MTQRNKKIALLIVLTIPTCDLSAQWIIDLIQNGGSIKNLFNIIIVWLFLVVSYLIENKTALNNKMRILFYFLYFLIAGTFGSTIIHQNQLNGQMIFLYLFLSFTGSLIWLSICKKLKTKK